MIQDTLGQIEKRIKDAGNLNPDRQQELLGLVQTLRKELDAVPETHRDQARSVAGFANISTHEAVRTDRDPKLLKLSLDGLAASVAEFETTHPRLAQIGNSICNTLSNLGI
ncbi:MAG TPA: DUF4404 family protein [Roseimicrobium sp.]|nr:DUF4404 family protein [Roseimicrobium sp.]